MGKRCLLFIIIAACLITGCASSEESLIEAIKENPKDTDSIAKLADIYYYGGKYYQSYRTFGRLEKLQPLSKFQKYQMAISETRCVRVDKKGGAGKKSDTKGGKKKPDQKSKRTPGKGWEKILPNSRIILRIPWRW